MGEAVEFQRSRAGSPLTELGDRELLARLVLEDEAALAELVRRKTAPLLRLVGRLLRDTEEARDIVQVTFLRLWEHRDRYDARFSPNTWIYRIATNLAIDHLRTRRVRERASEPLRFELLRGGESAAPDLSRLEGREVERILSELSESLTPRQRASFLLRELEGLNSSEVADILGCDESTVRNHLFHARRELQRQLARRYPEFLPEGKRRGEERR